MLILFDNGIPRGLAALLVGHTVHEARQHGWDELSNGELIQAAEDKGFELFLTNDKRIRYQQNLQGRRLAILVLSNSQWPAVRDAAGSILKAVNASSPGSYYEIEIPLRRG